MIYADGAFEDFRQTKAYNLTPAFSYNGAAEQGGAAVFGLVSGAAVSKYGNYGVVFDDIGASGPMAAQRGSINVRVVTPDGVLDSRLTTVTDEMRDVFRGNGYLDPRTNTFRAAPLNEAMAVDHIYPTARIVKLPGFETLTKEQMTNIVQARIGLGNLQPLPQSLNASKGQLLNWNTYKGNSLDSTYASNLMKEQQYLQQKIQDQIRAYQQINRAR